MADNHFDSEGVANLDESTQPDDFNAFAASLQSSQDSKQDEQNHEEESLEGKKFLGQFEDEEQATKAWNKLRSKHSQTVNENKSLKQKLAELEKASEEKALESMSESEQIKFLWSKLNQKPIEDNEDSSDSEPFDSDDVQAFIDSKPELSGAAGKVFKQLAEVNSEYTLESIYQSLMMPLFNDLGGRRIKKSPNLRINRPVEIDSSNISAMLERAKNDPKFYSENREKILKEAEKFF